MNKIYKLVWNKTRGCYVVAGEFAKRASKGAAVKALAAVVAAGVMSVGFGGTAWADDINIENKEGNVIVQGAIGNEVGSVTGGESNHNVLITGQDIEIQGGINNSVGSVTGGTSSNNMTINANGGVKVDSITGNVNVTNNYEAGKNVVFSPETPNEGEGKIPDPQSINSYKTTINNSVDGAIRFVNENKDAKDLNRFDIIYNVSLDYNTIYNNLKDKIDSGNANGTIVKVDNSGNLQLNASRNEETGEVTYELKLNNNINLGKEGSLKINNVEINKDGINAGDKKITNVAPGEISETSTEAVNGSQLHATNQAVQNNAENISRLGNKVDKLDSKVNKVGAGAAALAALHPLDFDPDEKLNVAAGYGHYKGEDAAAVGAFYRPNEDTMFSIGGKVGNGEDMINVGVSFRFGQQNHQTRTKKEMAKEIIDLRMEVAELKAMMYNIAGAGAAIDPAKMQLFPDVPSNHWAYEYVAKLAGNSILEGYPDGNFDGSRTMTRYEMAAIIYRALSRGVNVDERMLKEFGDVLARIRVDVLTRDHNNEPRIERVRVIPKEERKAALAAAGK